MLYMDESRETIVQSVPKEGNKDIKTIISELESIKSSTNFDEYTSDFSNDTCIAALMPEVIQTVNETTKNPLKVMVTVGSGPLWNIPKELEGIDLVISLDINPNQLQRNRQKRLEILSATSPEDLLPKPNLVVDKNNIFKVIHERNRMLATKTEKDSYLSYHYLFSEKKLRQTQEFLEKENMAFVGGDLSDPNLTETLGTILSNHQARIVFSDFSNVMEWVAGSPGHVIEDNKISFFESLKKLPFTENCPILHSHSIGRVGRSPIVAQLSFGLNDYFSK